MTYIVRHPGIVESTGNRCLRIRMVQSSGCGTCRARGCCPSADARESLVDVPAADASAYRVGDAVWVTGRLSMARRAVCWAYVFPFLIVLSSLVLFLGLGLAEAAAAGLSLALLAPYYAGLWLCRKRMARRFVLSVTPA